MSYLIDTHCHLADPRLQSQIGDVLERARQAGVQRVICAGANMQKSLAGAKLAERFDSVYFTAGVHPHDAAKAGDDYLSAVEQLAARAKNVAVGEIGLDYHYDFSPRDDQRRVFAEQLQLAARIDKPIVIHTRESFDDCLAVLAECETDSRRVVFHSFTGDASQVRRALDTGATIGFSGILTFKNAGDVREAATVVPDDRLLVETDAPYLSPEPVRKIRTNEPAHVAHVAVSLGEVRGVSPDALAELTTRNAIRFFGLQGVR